MPNRNFTACSKQTKFYTKLLYFNYPVLSLFLNKLSYYTNPIISNSIKKCLKMQKFDILIIIICLRQKHLILPINKFQ